MDNQLNNIKVKERQKIWLFHNKLLFNTIFVLKQTGICKIGITIPTEIKNIGQRIKRKNCLVYS